MYMELIAEILLAVLAVFGLYAMIRVFVTSRLAPTGTGVTLEIPEGTLPEDIPFLLDRLRDSIFLCANGRIVALIDGRLAEDTPLLEALRHEGVELYFIK